MNPAQHNRPQQNTSVISISEIKSSNVKEQYAMACAICP